MKRAVSIVFLLLAGAWLLAALDEPHVTASRPLAISTVYRFQVQGIDAVFVSPCKVTFRVRYYITPTYPRACFISAFIPDRAHHNRDFAYAPAGHPPAGVPKGQREFAENITFDAKYIGMSPYSSSAIEVSIYDAEGVRNAVVFAWRKNWTRFEIQDIRPIETRPDFVKFRVRYFIDPDYTPPCFLTCGYPVVARPYPDFAVYPAGWLPAGVAKGQVEFGADVWTYMRYQSGPTLLMTTVRMSIYDRSGGDLYIKNFPFNHTWVAPAH
jgi:hypothetical protein